jgi:drug/metabolite transporter (DMT)-like permease
MSLTQVGVRSRASEWARSLSLLQVGWGLAIFATILFSIAPPLVRFALLDGFDTAMLLLVRLWISVPIFGLTLAITDRQQLRLPLRGAAAAMLVGGVNALGMMLFFGALGQLEASLASMILSLSPPIVLSLLALRGERLTRRHLVRLGLALAGVYLLVGPGGQVNWTGVGLAAVATFLFSLQVALTQWLLVSYNSRTVAFYVTATMAGVVVLWWGLRGAPWTAPTPGGWWVVFTLAIVCTYLARLTYFAAIGTIGGAQISLLGPLETLLTVIWSILFLHERLTALQFAGGGLILASALLAVQRLGRVNLHLPRR